MSMPGRRRSFIRAMMFGVLALALPVAAPWNAPGAARAAELVLFETEGCPRCLAWDAEVGVIFHKTAEGRAAPLRRIDIDAPRPAELAALPDIIYTPTFVLMDGGREVGRILGYPGEDLFWGLFGALLGRLPAVSGS